MSPVSRELFLAGAGVVAGLVGTAGGITSLVSYPALLLAGVAPLQANIANLVAVVACWPGSAVVVPAGTARARALAAPLGRRRRRWAGRAAPCCCSTRPPACSAGWSRSSWPPGRWPCCSSRGSPPVPPGKTTPAGARHCSSRWACSSFPFYNGYFGAGSGVLLLALLLLTTDPHLATANAMKNMVVGAATIASAILFAVLTRVDWAAVAALGGRPLRRQPHRPRGGPPPAAIRPALAGRADRPRPRDQAVARPSRLTCALCGRDSQEPQRKRSASGNTRA